MPKLQDSKQHPDILEVSTKWTCHGPKITMVPINDGHLQMPHAQTPSPSKKRSLSPIFPTVETSDFYKLDQNPKQSQTLGKVYIIIGFVGQTLLVMISRHKTILCKSM